MTLTQEQLSKKLIGLKLQLPKRYHESIRELIDTDTALRARLEASEVLSASRMNALQGVSTQVNEYTARLEAAEKELKTYREWDNDADECYIPGHAQLQQQLAAAEGRVREMEAQRDEAVKTREGYDAWLAGGVYFTNDEYKRVCKDQMVERDTLTTRLAQVEAQAIAKRLRLLDGPRSKPVAIIMEVIAQAQREGRQQGIRLVGEDLQYGLPDVWKKLVLLRCEHLAELQAQGVGP